MTDSRHESASGPTGLPGLRVSAHRDQPDRSIVITRIGRSWSRKSASWSPGSEDR